MGSLAAGGTELAWRGGGQGERRRGKGIKVRRSEGRIKDVRFSRADKKKTQSCGHDGMAAERRLFVQGVTSAFLLPQAAIRVSFRRPSFFSTPQPFHESLIWAYVRPGTPAQKNPSKVEQHQWRERLWRR